MIECQLNFVVDVICELVRRNARRVTVRSSAEEQFLDAVEEKMKTTVWLNGNCGSWYTNSRGVVTTLWPWTCTNYWMKTRAVDHTQFHYD